MESACGAVLGSARRYAIITAHSLQLLLCADFMSAGGADSACAARMLALFSFRGVLALLAVFVCPCQAVCRKVSLLEGLLLVGLEVLCRYHYLKARLSKKEMVLPTIDV